MGVLTTTTSDLLGRPHYCQIGDPTVAAGAGMVPFLVQRAEIALIWHVQAANNEIGQVLGPGWEALIGGTVTLTMKGRSAAILIAFFKSIQAGAASTKFLGSLSARDQLTLNFMPIDAADPTDPTDAGARWVTNFIPRELGAWIAKLENTVESDTYTISGMIGFAATDQADQSLVAGYEQYFIGSAVNALAANPTNPWTLADPTA